MSYVNNTSVTFRTDVLKRDELDQLAESMDRDRSWVINEALDQYLDLQKWQIEHVRRSIEHTEAGGHTFTTEEVLERITKRTPSRIKSKG